MIDNNNQWVVTSFPDLLSFLRHLPPEIRTLQFVCFVLICVDTITGVIRHAYTGRLSSHAMRTKLLSKIACYFGLSILACMTTIVSQSYRPFLLSYYAIALVEVTSMVENLTVFAKRSGSDMTAVTKVLVYISNCFEVNQPTTEDSYTEIKTQSRIPKEEGKPIQETTTVQTITETRKLTDKEKKDTNNNATGSS